MFFRSKKVTLVLFGNANLKCICDLSIEHILLVIVLSTSHANLINLNLKKICVNQAQSLKRG